MTTIIGRRGDRRKARALWVFKARDGGKLFRSGGEFSQVRDARALGVDSRGVYYPTPADLGRIHYVHDPVSGDLVPSLLHEGVATNLINTEDLRKFIGWTAVSGVTPAITQGQTITPRGDVPGSPVGEATRIQTSGGTSVLKYEINVGSEGTRSTSLLVHNDGDVSVRVRLANSGGSQVANQVVAAGATEKVELTNVENMQRLGFASPDPGDDLDFLAWGPFIEEGVFASSFPGISGTTRPTDQLTRTREWSLADIEDGATWWLDVVNEGIFADTKAARRIYTNNDGATAVSSDGVRLAGSSSNTQVLWLARSGGSDVGSAAIPHATVANWQIGDRIRLACRLIADSGQHRLRIDYRRNDEAAVTGTASSLFDLFTTLSGTKESFFSRGNGVEACNVAALAGGIVQHTDGVPTFAQLEEEFA